MLSASFRNGRQVFRVAALLASVGGLAACNGAHLYNAEKDEAAQAALVSSKELSFQSAIDQARQNQVRLLSHELDGVAQFSRTRRDVELHKFLEGDVGGNTLLSAKLDAEVTKRLTEIFGTANTDPVTAAFSDLSGAKENLRDKHTSFKLGLGINPPACSSRAIQRMSKTEFIAGLLKRGRFDAGFSDDDKRKWAKSTLDPYVKDCSEVLAKQSAFLGSLGSDAALSDIYNRIAGERASLQEAVERFEVLDADRDRELKELKKSIESDGDKNSESFVKGLGETVKRIDAITKEIKKIPVGEERVSGQQIAKIDEFLLALEKGEASGDSPSKAALLAARIPGIFARLDTIRGLKNRPPVFSLTFQKQLLEVQRRQGRRENERLVAKVDLLTQLAGIVYREGIRLVKAKQLLREAVASNGGDAISITFLLSDSEDPQEDKARRMMVQSLSTYLSTITGPRRQAHEIEYRRIDIDHALALDRSEAALGAWEVAVKQPVAVLAAYHATGLKTENFVELLKTVGLFAIAVGEND